SVMSEPPLPSATVTKKRKAAWPTDAPLAVDPRFAPVVEAFANDAGVTRGKMMSAYGLKVRGKIFAMLMRDSLVVKLPKARVDELVAAGHGTRFEPRAGRAMKEWLVAQLPPTKWVDLAREAYAFVSVEA
ncbi:MAG TPA: TfoX/Sxy family protein, partial [Thermoanaerobaculia bacterium]|nr:TfoX/Sxy family protein [Thermoanaerobaculia bacterium]